MKYIIDLDAIKDCLDLLNNPTIINGNPTVYLADVIEMIDKFPKDEYEETAYRDALNDIREISVGMNKVNADILFGKGLSKI